MGWEHWKTDCPRLKHKKKNRDESLSYDRKRGTLVNEEARGSLGLEVPNSLQEPRVKLTVGDELINFLIDLTLKFFTGTAWHQSPARTHFKPTDGAQENPRKGDSSSPMLPTLPRSMKR